MAKENTVFQCEQYHIERQVGYIKLILSGVKGRISFSTRNSARTYASCDHKFVLTGCERVEQRHDYDVQSTDQRDRVILAISKHTGVPFFDICRQLVLAGLE